MLDDRSVGFGFSRAFFRQIEIDLSAQTPKVKWDQNLLPLSQSMTRKGGSLESFGDQSSYYLWD